MLNLVDAYVTLASTKVLTLAILEHFGYVHF